MIRVCGWCGKELGDISGGRGGGEADITHGICSSCVEWVTSGDNSSSLEDFLNRLNVPVLCVDDDVEIICANTSACSFLKKDLQEIQGVRGGEAFECSRARLPGGCGRSTHCKGCTIRRSVERTFESGEALHRVPALLHRASGEVTSEVGFLISTEKVGDVVLLRIDEAG